MRTLICIGTAVVLGYATPALAQTIDATNPAKLASVIQDVGYRATLDVDGAGDPMIRSKAGGTDFQIYFYGCDDGAECKWLLFKVGYDLPGGTTLATVNQWNANTLFGRAYLDDEDDPWLEMGVTLDGGVTQQNFADVVDWWDVVRREFEEHIDF